MDDKPVPAPPPETPKPIKTESDVRFSFRDLILEEVYEEGGYTYCLFMVKGQFFIIIKDYDYTHYLLHIFNEIKKRQAVDIESCICDECTPEVILVDDTSTIVTVTINEDKEESYEDKKANLYVAVNLIPHVKVGICDLKDKK